LILKKEEKQAAMFKFGTMKKKAPFIQKVKKTNDFVRPSDDVILHEPAIDGREREALIFPNRIKDKTVRNNYQ
jgi:hypothetical protein